MGRRGSVLLIACLLVLSGCGAGQTAQPARTADLVTVTVAAPTETVTQVVAETPEECYFCMNKEPDSAACDQLPALQGQRDRAMQLALELREEANRIRYEEGQYDNYIDADRRAFAAQDSASGLQTTVSGLQGQC